MFQLHQQLEKDCFVIGDLALCRILMLNDRQYPWIIAVPMRDGLSEIFQLDDKDQRLLLEELKHIDAMMNRLFTPDKMNIAALGNMVPQLHIHCIARFKVDAAWPNPVWGVNPSIAYSAEESQQRIDLIRENLLGSALVY